MRLITLAAAARAARRSGEVGNGSTMAQTFGMDVDTPEDTDIVDAGGEVVVDAGASSTPCSRRSATPRAWATGR